jgi:cytochrome P450 family 150 subfamily A5
MSTITDFDFFGLDQRSLEDPYAFYAAARDRGPVWQDPTNGVYLVTHYDDILDVVHRPEVFSSIIAATGPMTPLREPREGETVSDVIEEFRTQGISFMSDSLLTKDPPDHAKYRLLVGKLFTPKRLREVEDYARGLALELVEEFADRGEVEFVRAFAVPYPLLVIADLLGVPREDHDEFRKVLRGPDEIEVTRIGNPNEDMGAMSGEMLEMMAHLFTYFSSYIQDRKDNPRDDIMSELAAATFPGTDEVPSVQDLVGLAFILFGAGQETTVRLFTTGMKVLLEQPELQDWLRHDPARIPNFVEETLRYDTPVKGLFRVAREDTEIRGVKIPAGSTLMVMWASGNRDPEKFADPDRFDPNREDAKQTLSFGHGMHYCVGAPLARFEARLGFEALLGRMANIRLDPDRPKPEWLPSFILRGLTQLWLRFDPISG